MQSWPLCVLSREVITPETRRNHRPPWIMSPALLQQRFKPGLNLGRVLAARARGRVWDCAEEPCGAAVRG